MKDSFSVIALVSVMFYQNWKLASFAILMMPLAAAFARSLGKRVGKAIGKAGDSSGKLVTFLSEIFKGSKIIRIYQKEEKEAENANKMMFTDLNTLWLTHNNRVDHASMAASIEARVPYQDTYVTNNAKKLPMEMKVDNGNLLRNKIALRKIARKYLPNNIEVI